MADRDQKKFDPSSQRLAKAREDGNIFRSREIVSVGVLLSALSVIFLGMPFLFGMLERMMTRVFQAAGSTGLSRASIPPLLTELGIDVMLVMAPLLGLLMVSSFGLNVVQSGWNVSTKPLMPKFDRLSPLSGFKRIFSSQGLVELAKSLIKLAVVGPMVYLAIKQNLPEILMLHTLSLEEILSTSSGWIMTLVFKMLAALTALSAGDYFYGKWKHKQDLKMTQEEVKEENKQQEGDPHVKGKRRQMAMQMMRRARVDQAVQQADVVITNPTHYAIALRYDPLMGGAPRVLAKGIRKRALKMKELAKQYGIPTVEDRPLARALYANVEEEQEIPVELYAAVAAILAEIFRNRRRAGL